ncbi:PhoD-like phosphatase [Toxoplasma gondii GAB2-2007-GAL-DOM2]|uniref:PhoD-like phosphatase n=2 Tax=Toxoplasma gondii TaxID=5811 RepID=B9QIR8_TOXGV|nr:PhoD-like phosphatase [Toxoplasma gondii VEG]KFG29696.1 PhoD-like phosphatase [Toxoplasma gondii GAB2-2007-GAL-DOM2]CEL72153.1 TPA: hypothetical protein BN1205_056090 [Toxoplasma gondii VEG]
MPPPCVSAPSRRAGDDLPPQRKASRLSSLLLLFLLTLHFSPVAVESVSTRGGDSREAEESRTEDGPVAEAQSGFVTLQEAEKGGRQAFNPSVYTPEKIRISRRGPIRFMFGSCNLQPIGGEWQVAEEDRHMWSFITRQKPDLFALLGDNVYAHNFRHLGLANSIRWNWKNLSWSELTRRRIEVARAFHRPSTLDEVRQAFHNQTSHRPYQEFLDTGVHVIGTYDDHDLGDDNPSRVHSLKYEARDIVLDFFNVSKNSPRRSVFWDGAFSSHKIQLDDGFAFRVILLDVRFNRDPWASLPHGDILGNQQWRWLKEELRKSKEEGDAVTFIASSIQVLPSPFVATEAWSIFPDARRRLLNLIMSSGVQIPVLLSGDVHFAEMNRVLCRPLSIGGAAAPAKQTGGPGAAPSVPAQCLSPSPWQQVALLLWRLDRQSEDAERHAAASDTLGVDVAFAGPSRPPEASLEFQENRSLTAWRSPGLLARLFPSLSFLSTFVFMNLFAPSAATTFSLFSASHPADEYLPVVQRPETRRKGRSGAQEREKFRDAGDLEGRSGRRAGRERRGVELNEVTSSGLTHGVEETFLTAAAPARLAEWGLRRLFPRTSTSRDDFYGERLVYTRRNVGDVQLVRNPLSLLRAGAAEAERRTNKKAKKKEHEKKDTEEATDPQAEEAEERKEQRGPASETGGLEEARAAYSELLSAVSCGEGDEERLSPSVLEKVGRFFAGSPGRFHMLLSLYQQLLAVHDRPQRQEREKTKLNISPRKAWGACSQGEASALAHLSQRERDENAGLRRSVWCWEDEEQEKEKSGESDRAKTERGESESDTVEYGNRPNVPYPLLRNDSFFSLLLTVESLLHTSLQRLSRSVSSSSFSSSFFSSSSSSSSSVFPSSSWTEELASFCELSRSPSREAVGGMLRFLNRENVDLSGRDPSDALRKRRLLHWASVARDETQQICSALAAVFPTGEEPGEKQRGSTQENHLREEDMQETAQASGGSSRKAKHGSREEKVEREKEALRALSQVAWKSSMDEEKVAGKAEKAGEAEEAGEAGGASDRFADEGVSCRNVEEILSARAWISVQIFALPFGDLVLESFISPFAFAQSRRRLETELEEEMGEAADARRVRWICDPPEGPDPTPVYVAVAVLLLLVLFAAFSTLILRALWSCCACACAFACVRQSAKSAERGEGENRLKTRGEEEARARGSVALSTSVRRRRVV